MKNLLWILIIVLIGWGSTKFAAYYNEVKRKSEGPTPEEIAAKSRELPALSPQMESSLQQAKAGGAAAFKAWLDRYANSIQDPKRADIELDYVQMLARSDPAGARRLFATIRPRIPADSIIIDRVKKLEKIYQ